MSKNSLIFGRAFFFLIVFVIFGVIIVNEKGKELFLPKATNKINDYFDEKYSNIKEETKTSKVKYDINGFKMKVTSKNNNNLFFYIIYSNKKIKDTYKKDYYEGASLFKHINNKLEKEINKLTDNKCKVKNISSLDNYTEQVKERIINEENLLSLKYYYIEQEVTVNNMNSDTIYKEIESIINKNTKNKINPKYYNIIITDKNDITNSIKIMNITDSFINNADKMSIINDILNKNNSKLLENNHIKYKYLNEEE